MLSKEGGGSSAADKFIAYFHKKDNISFVCLFDEIETDLIPLSRGRERAEESSALFMNIQMKLILISQLWILMMSHQKHMQTGFEMQTTKVLLGITWVTDKQHHLFSFFLELLASDVVMGTNAEKWPLAHNAGKTSDNQTFTAIQVYLPLQCHWDFDWHFWVAIPMLQLKTAIESNHLNVTDGDEKEYNAFIAVTGTDKIFTQSSHGLCSFHLIDQGFKDNGIMNIYQRVQHRVAATM